MDFTTFLCFSIIIGFFGLIGLVIFLVARGSGGKNATPVNAVNGRVYLRPEHRQAFRNVLQQIQQAPDREVALNEAAATVETALWLPLSGSLADVQAIAAPPTLVVPTPSTSVATPSDGTTDAKAGVSAASPVIPTPSLRWLAPDNITLLLYVGAALMVIAAGVFVASSWDAISGMARFLVVAVFALAFLIVGELFIKLTQRLRPAGTTFRAVGTLLLPFIPLAYDRFVLEGEGPIWYWLVAGAILAAVNYAFYRFTNRGRLTAYLAVFSLGIMAVALPPAIGADARWTAASIWSLSGILFFIMARLEPDGSVLLKNLFRPTNHPIAESHLILGVLFLLVGLLFGVAIDGDIYNAVNFAVLAVVLLGIATYFRGAVLAALAALAGGYALGAAADLVSAPFVFTLPLLILALYAVALMAIAPFAEKRMRLANGFLTATALFWAFVARDSGSGDFTPLWVYGVTIAVYISLTLWAAYRFRNPLVWTVLWLVTNAAVIDTLSLIPSDSNSILIPTLLYLAVAGLWLLLERVLPAPQSRYARFSFVVQAAWMTLAALFFQIVVRNLEESEIVGAAIALTGLTLGWIWVAYRTRLSATVGVAILEGALALPFILLAINAPDILLPVTWLAAGVILLGLATVIPDFAKRVTERGGLILTLIAPLGIVVADWFRFSAPSESLQTLTAQGTLLGAAAAYAGYGLLKRQRWGIGSAGALLYVLYAWVINEQGIEEIQVYSVPLALLLFSYRWLFPTQLQLWEGLSAVVLIGVGMAQALVEENWIYSAILGAWGVLLLGLGITMSRRILLVAGVVGILFAALRQLWTVVAELPPALIIGLAGLTFLLVAIVLLLTRERWLKVVSKGDEEGGQA